MTISAPKLDTINAIIAHDANNSNLGISINQTSAALKSPIIHKDNDQILQQSENKQHNLYILGDDSLLCLSVAVLKSRRGKWNDQYKPKAFVKNGAKSTHILEECIDSLTEFDVVLLGVGSNDSNPTKLQSYLCIVLLLLCIMPL